MGYSKSTSSSPCSQKSDVALVSGRPVTCASACSYEAKDRSDSSDRRVETIRGAESAVSSS
jgi:hypothetical protein